MRPLLSSQGGLGDSEEEVGDTGRSFQGGEGVRRYDERGRKERMVPKSNTQENRASQEGRPQLMD